MNSVLVYLNLCLYIYIHVYVYIYIYVKSPFMPYETIKTNGLLTSYWSCREIARFPLCFSTCCFVSSLLGKTVKHNLLVSSFVGSDRHRLSVAVVKFYTLFLVEIPIK